MVIIQLDSEQLNSLIENACQKAVRKVFIDPHPSLCSSPQEEKPLSIADAADYLGIAKQTIYQNIDRIPHKKRFGRLFFFRSQLAEYLNAGEGVSHD